MHPNRYSAMQWLQGKLRQRVAQLPTEMSSLDEWQTYRERIIDYLANRFRLSGWGPPPPSGVVGSGPMADDVVVEWIDVGIADDLYMPVHLYRPARPVGRCPAVIVSHGFGQDKRDLGIVKTCRALARAGMIAVAVEHAPSGERADRPDYRSNIDNITHIGLVLGISNPALWALDHIRTADYLVTREDVDPTKLGIVGLCQGSIGVWPTIAYDQRFVASIAFAGVTSLEAVCLEYMSGIGGWSGPSPFFFDILDVADIPQLLGCVAPRPMMFLQNINDIHWPLRGLRQAERFCTSVYALYGRPDRLDIQLDADAHAYTDTYCGHIVRYFRRRLVDGPE